MRNISRRSGRGVTLIELLVVIAIIGLLTSLLIPVVFSSIRKGRETRARHLIDQVSQALQGYRTEYKQWPPCLEDLPKNADGDYVLRVNPEERNPHPVWKTLFITLVARAENPAEEEILESNNRRHLRFLEVEPHMTNRPDAPLEATTFVDPWNQQLNLVHDGDGNEIITGLPDKKSGKPTTFKTYGELGIWSWGYKPKKVKHSLSSWK